MQTNISVNDMTQEQRELWERVHRLWELSKGRNKNEIRSSLHPLYVGWDMRSSFPHDREAAVNSVTDDSQELQSYELQPLSVQIYNGKVGVVHYTYSARVTPKDGDALNVSGKWSEVYLKDSGTWQMISVSGMPSDN